ADAGIGGERRPDAEALEQLEEAPAADPHAVFVPRPVHHVGHERHAGRGGGHPARQGAAGVPPPGIGDGPEDQAPLARQFQRRTVDDGRILDALARDHGIGHSWFSLLTDAAPILHVRAFLSEMAGTSPAMTIVGGAWRGYPATVLHLSARRSAPRSDSAKIV